MMPQPKFPRSSTLSGATRTLATSPNCPQAMVKQGTWTVDDFTIIREIGRGRASVVHHAVCKRVHHPVALKIYRKASLTDVTRRQVEREIEIHAGVAHPHVIDCYVVFEDTTAFYMALEYAPGGDLMKVLSGSRRLSDKQTREALSQVMSALQHLHSKSVVHRDIKPENILVTREGTLKLADLGTAIDLRKERAVSRLGTLDYMAPEVLKCPDKRRAADYKEREDLMYCVAVDVWAVGILAFELMTGSPPFERDSVKDTVAQIMSESQTCPAWMTSHATSFIHSALEKEPSNRPAIQQLATHAFVASPIPSEEASLAEMLMPSNLLTRHRSLEVSPPGAGGEDADEALLPLPSPTPLQRTPSAPFSCGPLRSASARRHAPSPLSSPSRPSRFAPSPPSPQPPAPPRSPFAPVTRPESCGQPSTRFSSPISRLATASPPPANLLHSETPTMRTLFADESTSHGGALDAGSPSVQDVTPAALVEATVTDKEDEHKDGAVSSGATASREEVLCEGEGGHEEEVEEKQMTKGVASCERSSFEAEEHETVGRGLLSSSIQTLHKRALQAQHKAWQCDIRSSWSSASSSESLTLSPASSCGSITFIKVPPSPKTPSPTDNACAEYSTPGFRSPKRCASFSGASATSTDSPRSVNMLPERSDRRPTWPESNGQQINSNILPAEAQ